MLAHAAEPILGVREIAFAAVHDAVPEAAGRGVDALADGVRLIKKIMQQPDAGEAAGGHVGVGELIWSAVVLRVRECGRDRKCFEYGAGGRVRLADVERAATIDGEEWCEDWAVGGRVEWFHDRGSWRLQ